MGRAISSRLATLIFVLCVPFNVAAAENTESWAVYGCQNSPAQEKPVCGPLTEEIVTPGGGKAKFETPKSIIPGTSPDYIGLRLCPGSAKPGESSECRMTGIAIRPETQVSVGLHKNEALDLEVGVTSRLEGEPPSPEL